MDLYLCKLKSAGLIDRRKKRFARDLRGIIELTPSGRNRLRGIRNTMEGKVLSSKFHNISGAVTLRSILERIKDPVEKVFFLSLFNYNTSFDLVTYLMLSEMSRDETNLLNVLACNGQPWLKGRSGSFPDQLFNASLYGNIDAEVLSSAFWEKGSEDVLLLLAEAKIKIGRLEEAKMVHDHLLSSVEGLNDDQKLVLTMDRAAYLVRYGEHLTAIKELEIEGRRNDNEVHKALLELMRASIIVYHLDRSSKKDHFKKCIKTFDSLDLPLLSSRAYGIRGMAYLRFGDIERAEEDLVNARKAAVRAGSPMAEARALLDLSKLAFQKGKFDLAMSYLKRSKVIFQKTSILEPASYAEFQMALLEVERGRTKQSVMHYRNCALVAQPLPSVLTLMSYRDQLERIALEKGNEDVQKLIYTL